MKYYAHLNTAVSLLNAYTGEMPFGNYSKAFFREHKKYGSGDRKNISRLCYAYFRLGKALREGPVEEKVLAALFLTVMVPDKVLAFLKPDWHDWLEEQTNTDLQHRLTFLQAIYPSLMLESVFPWKEQLSAGVDPAAFIAAFFVQPDLFIRVRPGQYNTVATRLQKENIPADWLTETSARLPNATPVQDWFVLNREVVIQDYSSQRVGYLLSKLPRENKTLLKVWDCCAASGGKSIMATDRLGKIDLTVSDVRDTILHNLRRRFTEAGIDHYQSFTADLTSLVPASLQKSFDLIIADVPCSGSGTWSRTPEQLAFFDSTRISYYAALQRQIVSNILPALKQGGYLLYITCSVFRAENEAITQLLETQYGLKQVGGGIITGYTEKADTMYAVLLRKEG